MSLANPRSSTLLLGRERRERWGCDSPDTGRSLHGFHRVCQRHLDKSILPSYSPLEEPVFLEELT